MRRPRISIAGLLALVVLFALGFAALRYASASWAAATTMTALGVLLASILGAWTGRDRVFWTGFALFGWGYAVLNYVSWLDATFKPQPIVLNLLDDLYPLLHADPPRMSVFGISGKGGPLKPGRPGPVAMGTPQHRAFQQVGTAVVCLTFALAGGVVAKVIAARGRPERDDGRGP